MAERLVPVLWSGFHVLKSVGNWLLGRWVNGRTARWLLAASWLWGALLYGGFAVASTAWQVGGLFVGYAGFCALKEPAEKTLVAALASPERKGLAFGAFHLSVGVAGLPAGVMFGYLYQTHGAAAAFLAGAAWMTAGAVWLAMGGIRRP